MSLKTHYLNIDLDLEASFDLTLLAHRGLCMLHVQQWEDGSWSARFKIEEQFEEPDPNIAAILTAVEALDEPSRDLWLACTLRNFDIG